MHLFSTFHAEEKWKKSGKKAKKKLERKSKESQKEKGDISKESSGFCIQLQMLTKQKKQNLRK